LIVGALVIFIIANTLLADPHAGAAPLEPASDTGPCSLAQTVPATIVLVDDDFDLLLDDGRRVALAGIELPSANGENAKLHALAWQRLSNWLAGAQVYLAALAPAPTVGAGFPRRSSRRRTQPPIRHTFPLGR